MTDLLQEAFERGIINENSVHDAIMASRKQQVIKMHPYKISLGSDGRYQTMFMLSNGKRKNVKGQTEDDVINKLVALYFENSHIDKLTFHDVYTEWLEYKRSITSSVNTIVRHTEHYNKYLKGSKLDGMRFSRIDKLTLTAECNKIIKEFNMSCHEWCNVKTILNGMYEFAVDKKYVKESIIKQVKLTVKFRQTIKKTGKTETYNTNELSELNGFLDSKISETNDSAFYAVRINLLCGLRVGELVALKWDDIEGTRLHVTREEIRNRETNTYEVVSHTKTYQDGYVTLVPLALELLNKIERQGEYIFMRDGKRLTSRQVQYVLEKFAKQVGRAAKRSHKMRKTYASRLSQNGVPLDFIREQLRHTSLKTTLNYIYNPCTDEETYTLLTNALQ